jgi:hypothetical protein
MTPLTNSIEQINPIAFTSGERELVRDKLGEMKIEVPGLRAKVADDTESLLYALDAEAGNVARKAAAIACARDAVSLAHAEFMSLTSQPAPWMQVKAAAKKIEEAGIEAADLVFDTEPDVIHALEEDFTARWASAPRRAQ